MSFENNKKNIISEKLVIHKDIRNDKSLHPVI
jgi:hypothetical protein